MSKVTNSIPELPIDKVVTTPVQTKPVPDQTRTTPQQPASNPNQQTGGNNTPPKTDTEEEAEIEAIREEERRRTEKRIRKLKQEKVDKKLKNLKPAEANKRSPVERALFEAKMRNAERRTTLSVRTRKGCRRRRTRRP